MKTKVPLISVVDDDESIRESLAHLLGELGYVAPAFSSAEEFLGSEYLDKTDCLILDVAMPGMTGPELQSELLVRRRRIPIIFISGERDQMFRRRLLELGAVEYLLKPFSQGDLLAAVDAVFRAS